MLTSGHVSHHPFELSLVTVGVNLTDELVAIIGSTFKSRNDR